jgi:hypothetical protein
VNITIEYVILIPLLFTQVIVFPLVANTIASSWQESQRYASLQETADHLASSVQQLYLTLNREEVLAGNITHTLRIPETIDSYPYTVSGSLSSPLDPDSNRILTLTLAIEGGSSVKAAAVMGSNVNWDEESALQRNSDPLLRIQKFSNGTMALGFGG